MFVGARVGKNYEPAEGRTLPLPTPRSQTPNSVGCLHDSPGREVPSDLLRSLLGHGCPCCGAAGELLGSPPPHRESAVSLGVQQPTEGLGNREEGKQAGTREANLLLPDPPAPSPNRARAASSGRAVESASTAERQALYAGATNSFYQVRVP